MIKNQANIYQFVLRDMIGQGVTGLSPTVRIRKDTGSFTATTNTPTEVGYGLYEVALTATECNCDIMALEVTLPDGQFPAILTNEYLTTGGATPQQIWEYSGGRNVDNTISSVNDIWGRQSGDTTSRTLTASPTDISGLATSSALSGVATTANAIKAKTDNLPSSPAAVGSEMALTSAQTTSLVNGVLNASVSNRDSGSLGATVLAISGYTDEVESKIDSVSAKLADLPVVRALLDRWAVSGSTLTCYDSTGNVLESCTLTKDDNGDIIAVTPDD